MDALKKALSMELLEGVEVQKQGISQDQVLVMISAMLEIAKPEVVQNKMRNILEREKTVELSPGAHLQIKELEELLK